MSNGASEPRGAGAPERAQGSDKRAVDVAEQRRLNDAREAGIALEEVGAVPERAAVGHGPRGLQRGRQRLELLHPRSVALARLPLGRGRPRRHLGRRTAALLRARALERARSDPEGAPVRPDQQRGRITARTSRSTTSTSTRPPTHSYMKYLYKYPQREFPYRDLVETSRRRSRDGVRVRAARHRASSTTTATSTSSSSTPRRARKTS